ncbi:MAG: polysaccharide pyruvyl transferase family protein [[Ruminococcus] lactaris]|uniref:polysaccharide pyruvyl transferase family protein n=1 Tax=[Ruminococcus] lactaris TaxID=46228 RepID=UPI0039A3BE2E
MSKYENWTDIIDLICSCKMVLSESLHGLIVAESYSIPSVWVEIILIICRGNGILNLMIFIALFVKKE